MKPLKLFVIGLMSIATTPLVAAPTDDFVTTWKTDNPGTSNSTSITNGDGESGRSPSLEVAIDLIFANSFESQQITSIVDDPDNSVGFDSSIVIGADNYPVISYRDSNANMLKVAKCNDTACSGNDETVTSVTSGGRATSIAISKDGFPVISHRNDALLMVTKCNDVACAGGDELTTQVDDSLGGLSSAICTSLAISGDGYPVIAYGDREEGVLKVAKCDDVACTGGGEILSVAFDPTNSGEIAGSVCSLAIGRDGNPVISSGRFFILTSHLVVTKCNDAACAGGDETTTELDGPNIGHTSIAVGRDNNPVISYRRANHVRVAHCNDAACTGNNELVSIVDDVDDVGEFNSIAIGDDGFPVISYFDRTAGALKIAKCNDEACTGDNETITTVDDPPTSAGFDTSITIGHDSRPVISYWQYEESGAKLKVTRCGNASCDD